MSEVISNQILQQAVVNLLALAEVAVELTPEQREALATHARELEKNPTEEQLALVNWEVRRLLGQVTGFGEIVRTWETGLPFRVGLNVDPLNRSLPRSSGRTPFDAVNIIMVQGLSDPLELARDKARVQDLQESLGHSPRQSQKSRPGEDEEPGSRS